MRRYSHQLKLARLRQRRAFTVIESLVMLGLLGAITVLVLSLIRFHFRADGNGDRKSPDSEASAPAASPASVAP